MAPAAISFTHIDRFFAGKISAESTSHG